MTSACALCGSSSDHTVSRCPWRGKGEAMAFFLLGCGMVLAAIGITETVRGWAAGDGGLAQGLAGIFVALLGGWMVAVSALRLMV